jgi:glycosyltransferase involved in cell wall biosynthesis
VLDLLVVFISRYLYSNKIYLEVNEVPRFKLQGEHNILKKMGHMVYSHIFEFTFKYYRGLLCISENIYHFYEKSNKNKLIIPILCSPDDKYQHFIYSSRVHLKSNPVIFLFSGSISIEKENLVELFKGFSLLLKCGVNAELHFYGTVAKDSMKNIVNLLLELGIFDAVKFFGVYENKNVYSILRTADALLLPRGNTNQNFYGFSTKLSEYLVSGVPIIMTNIGEVNKYFLHGYNCILLNNFDSLSFYSSLLEFKNMSVENRKSLAINALQTAYMYFDFKLFSNKISSFLS